MTFKELIYHTEVISHNPIFDTMITYDAACMIFIISIFLLLFATMNVGKRSGKVLGFIVVCLWGVGSVGVYEWCSAIKDIKKEVDVVASYKELHKYFMEYKPKDISGLSRKDLSKIVNRADSLIEDTISLKERLELLGVKFDNDKVLTLAQNDDTVKN